jgi:hypothetical protein
MSRGVEHLNGHGSHGEGISLREKHLRISGAAGVSHVRGEIVLRVAEHEGILFVDCQKGPGFGAHNLRTTHMIRMPVGKENPFQGEIMLFYELQRFPRIPSGIHEKGLTLIIPEQICVTGPSLQRETSMSAPKVPV